MEQETRIHPRRHVLANWINEPDNPLVVLSPIDPCGHAASRFDLRHQRLKACPRVRQVMQYAYREGVIEDRAQRQMVNVRLDDMRILNRTRGSKSQVHRFA